MAHPRLLGNLRNQHLRWQRRFRTDRIGASALTVQPGISAYGPGTFNALCPAAPYGQAGCPIHTSSSGADVTNELSYQFLGQNLKSNTFELQYDFTRRLSGRLGYLYTNRSIAQMSDTFDVGEFYFPGGTGAAAANDYLAARGDCAFPAAPAPHVLPAGCTLITTGPSAGAIVEGSPADLVPEAGNDTSRVITTINENLLLAGLTYRPIDAI